MKTKTILLIVTPLCALVIYFFITSPSRLPPIPIVIVRFDTPHSGLIQIAQAKGYFAEEGLAVTMKSMQVGTEASTRVLSGEADFGTTAETPVALALARGEKPKIISTIFSSRWSSGIVVRKDHGILKAGDLNGKRIGFVFGTNTQYDLENFLTFHSIPIDAVTMVQGSPMELTALLISGKLDAASIWVPYMTQMQTELGDRAQVFFRDEAYPQTINLIVRPAYVSEHREAVDRVLRALYRSEAFVREHPDEAYGIIARASNADINVLRDHGDPLTYELTLRQSLLIATENQIHWFFNRGLVEKRPFPDVLDAFETEPLRALKPTDVTISK